MQGDNFFAKMKAILFAIFVMIVTSVFSLNDEELDAVNDIELSFSEDEPEEPIKLSRKRERIDKDENEEEEDEEGDDEAESDQQDDDNPVEELKEEFKLLQFGKRKRAETKVSVAHYDELSKFSWSLDTKGYAFARINDKSWRMHLYVYKVILGLVVPKGHVVDHRNRISLDNRAGNLRPVTRLVNSRNRTVVKGKDPKSRNITYFQKPNKFLVLITVDGLTQSFGYHTTFKQASLVRDGALLTIFGDNLEPHGYDNIPAKRSKLAVEAYNNRQQRPDKSSKYNYVYVNGNKYGACMTRDRVKLLDKQFDFEEDAARAVDACIVNNNFPVEKLNFPLEHVGYVQVVVPRYPAVDIDGDPESIGIKIPCGVTIVVDRDKYDMVKYLRMSLQREGNYVKYTVRSGNKTHMIARFLTGETREEIHVDHIDNDTKNNRMSNLRSVTPGVNAENKQLSKKNTSGYKNVSRSYDMWKASIRHQGKLVIDSMFYEKIDAVIAVDLAILVHLPNTGYKPSVGVWNHSDPDTFKRELDRINAILIARPRGKPI